MTADLGIEVPAALPVTRCKARRSDGSRCSRPLRDPVSVARGIGPECWDRTHPAPGRPRAGEWPSSPADPVLPLPPTQPVIPLEET